MRVERVILEATTDVPLPGLLFHPPSDAAPGDAGVAPAGSQVRPLPAAVLVHDAGRTPDASPGGLARALAQTGVRTLAIDLRGWGETAWQEQSYGWSADRRDILSADNMLFYVAYALGSSPVALRVHDLLAGLAWMRARPDVDPRRIALVGTGGGGIVALHAALIAGEIGAVVCRRTLAGYRSVVDAARCAHPVADFVPGALRDYDLPDLVAALAPVPVLLDQISAKDVAEWICDVLNSGQRL